MTAKSNTDEGPEDPLVQFNVRIPLSLKNIIEKYGKENQRSTNKAGHYLLLKALEAEGYGAN